MDDAIFERYIKDGKDELKEMSELLTSEKELTDKYHESLNKIKNKKAVPSTEIEMLSEKDDIYLHIAEDNWRIIGIMLEDGLIIKDKERIVFNHPMTNSLQKFLRFLLEKGDG